jgi:hypothetical protein
MCDALCPLCVRDCVSIEEAPLLSSGATDGRYAQMQSPRSTSPMLRKACTFAQLGDVSVSPNAPMGAVCTITADMAGDATYNSAPQVQQDIVITAAESPVTSVPALNPWAMFVLVSWLAAIGAMFRRCVVRRL